jgi:hypothetical protein
MVLRHSLLAHSPLSNCKHAHFARNVASSKACHGVQGANTTRYIPSLLSLYPLSRLRASLQKPKRSESPATSSIYPPTFEDSILREVRVGLIMTLVVKLERICFQGFPKVIPLHDISKCHDIHAEHVSFGAQYSKTFLSRLWLAYMLYMLP